MHPLNVDQMILELHISDDPEEVGYYSGLIESLFAIMGLLTSAYDSYRPFRSYSFSYLCVSNAMDICYRSLGTKTRSSHLHTWNGSIHTSLRTQPFILAYVRDTIFWRCLCRRVYVRTLVLVPFQVMDELIDVL